MAEEIWAQTFKYLADNKVLFEGMLLKPSMVTPGADSGKKVLLALSPLLQSLKSAPSLLVLVNASANVTPRTDLEKCC